MDQDDRPNKTQRDQGKNKLVTTKSSMFNMPKNTRTPNVFTTAPRPGGYMQTMPSSNVNDTSHAATALGIRYKQPPQSDRVKLIEQFQNRDTWWDEDLAKGGCPADQTTSGPKSQYQSQSQSKSPDNSAIDEDFWPTGKKGLAENCNYVMSIVISTIMTLAANPKTKPPDHHLSWTMNFLNSIKDDDNKTPRNIKALKKVMKPFLENVPKPLLIPEDHSLESRSRMYKDTRGETLQLGKTGGTSGNQSNSFASQQSQMGTSKSKGGVPATRKPSSESNGNRSPTQSRRSSWR